MTKKNKFQKNKPQNNKPTSSQNENMLPQNIVSIGERVEEGKNIYISQSCYKSIHKFTEGKTVNESGGMLIGRIVDEFGKTNIIIEGFIEAKFSESTPTTLKFTHETWEYCHKEIEKKYSGQKIVGWIHTHPNFGIFLSEYDKFIQENFFKEDYQIAYVVDSIQNIEGFYFWINGKIERCKGFYVFDKTGIKILLDETSEIETTNFKQKDDIFSTKNIVLAILVIAIVFLAFSLISVNGQVNSLKQKQQSFANAFNQNAVYFQQQIDALKNELSKTNQPAGSGGNNTSSQNNNSNGTTSQPKTTNGTSRTSSSSTSSSTSTSNGATSNGK